MHVAKANILTLSPLALPALLAEYSASRDRVLSRVRKAGHTFRLPLTLTARAACRTRLGLEFVHEMGMPPVSINPNQKYPALVDDGFVIYESFAMTQYLATKYGADTPLAPANVEEAALVQQWSLWCITETEAPILSLMTKGQMGAPADQTEAAEKLVRPLTALEESLAGDTEYLVGDRFTVADLNVCSIIGSWGIRGAKLDLSPYPNVAAWATACMARPACKPPKTQKPKL
jgi:glutathione S-transferase